MTSLCNINGSIHAESEGFIPVLDRGFLFGDSVYEVMRTRDRVPFAWQEHLTRLRTSAKGIAIEVELSDGEIMGRIRETMSASGPGEKYLRIIITRGCGSAPNIDLSHAKGPQTVVLMVRDLPDVQGKISKLAVIPRLRIDRRALDPAIKSGNYLNNLLGLAEARAVGATDCLFLNAEGMVTEASTSNFFLVKDGRVMTPPLSAGLLGGITRSMLFDCMVGVGRKIEECDLSSEDIHAADELFLSSTLRDISPVVAVDGRKVGTGAPGHETSRLARDFSAYCERKVEQVDAPSYRLLTEPGGQVG